VPDVVTVTFLASAGVLGAAVGIHWSLGLSSVVLCLGTLAAGIYALRGRPATAEASRSNARNSGTARTRP
jgi:hypothetical protein